MSVALTEKEAEKLHIIKQTQTGIITNEEAAIMIGITIRQVQP